MIRGKMYQEDTIAAIATGITNAGISIIRISGSDSISVAEKIFHSKKEINWTDVESHTVHYGYINDGEELIDEVLLLVFRAPKTYTKEDVVEIDCHGGTAVTRRVLDSILKNGARLAEPGEFTKRAFLNGRIDLSQAEAVMEVIEANGQLALKQSMNQLRGRLKNKIQKLRSVILDDISYIEAALDDPEHISIDEYSKTLEEHMKSVLGEIQGLSETFENGKMIREGINTIILGRPNAGKSTLLNYLAGEERAIVTEIAGTTRDLLEIPIRLNGVQLNITDTAGLHTTDDPIEKIGVKRALEKVEGSDLIIYLIDSGKRPDAEEINFLKQKRDCKIIIVLNKCDLVKHMTKEELFELTGIEAIEISARDGIGTKNLEHRIDELYQLGIEKDSEPLYITNERHKEALKNAENSMCQAEKSRACGMSEDFISIDLMGAYQALGKILGETLEEDLINNIFEKFCMGK